MSVFSPQVLGFSSQRKKTDVYAVILQLEKRYIDLDTTVRCWSMYKYIKCHHYRCDCVMLILRF